MSNTNFNEPALRLDINGRAFDWHEQYIRGIEVKDLGGIKAEDPLFLEVPAPWVPELIHNHTRIDLAREGLGAVRFVSRDKHPDRIILTIETTNGDWENGEFNKHLTIGQLIEKVVNRFKFAKDGKYALRIKGQEKDLDKNATLESLHLKDHTVLVFIDLGSGA
jgi:hypothetical protein